MKKYTIQRAACLLVTVAALIVEASRVSRWRALRRHSRAMWERSPTSSADWQRCSTRSMTTGQVPACVLTADVLNLIVMENGLLAGTLTGAAPGARPAPVTDPAKMQDALKASYANLKKVIEGLSDSDLNASVKMFGRDTNKRGAIQMALTDQHEHLGQLIAYSRVNGIVPPWSK